MLDDLSARGSQDQTFERSTATGADDTSTAVSPCYTMPARRHIGGPSGRSALPDTASALRYHGQAAEMVVIGNDWQTAAGEAAGAAMAQKLAGATSCPLVAVPPNAPVDRFDRNDVMLAFDGEAHSYGAADFALPFRARCRLRSFGTAWHLRPWWPTAQSTTGRSMTGIREY